ncbi:DUF2165 domain-containing protein [Orbus sturtevantii]|uniref:DUF2165 family protein n=1 Tax=Orbus sturtevantii TaxID=3074109 RepID=UPI00370D6CEF
MKCNLCLVSVQHLSKATIAFFVGFFCLLVGYDNIIDFNTNYQFVNSVLSMDKMEPFFSDNPTLEARAIVNPTFHLFAYWVIIIGELFTGLICMSASLYMFASINKPRFVTGQVIYLVGATFAVLLWYFGFAVIGGEYFSMWANKMNGQMKAYTFSMFILITAIYVYMPELKKIAKNDLPNG